MHVLRRRIIRIISYFAFAVPATLTAQRTAQDSVRAVAAVDAQLVKHAAVFERELWPGYRYDSLAVLYMLPRVGKLAMRWPGEPPSGMAALPGFERAWWADTQVVRWSGGLPVGYANVYGGNRAQLIGLALHEAFHAHEAKSARSGRRFGAGENSLLTAQYPVFDVANEASFAVEARLLSRALRAREIAESKRLAAQFLAVRRMRHARMDPRFVEYERLAEQHEGLAEYVYHRGLALMVRLDTTLQRDARAELESEHTALAGTLRAGALSIRRRFYATGSIMGLLLDRFGDASWKTRLVRDDMWLQDLLGQSVGTAELSTATKAELDAAFGEALRAVTPLRERRIQQRDSILSAPGTRVLLRIAVPSVSWCMFDPQNLLMTDAGQLLHMRTVSYCSGSAKVAELDTPVVEDRFTSTMHFVIREAMELTVGGQRQALPVSGDALTADNMVLRSAGVTITAARAVVATTAGGVEILVLRP
jgi:hypothetical protein